MQAFCTDIEADVGGSGAFRNVSVCKKCRYRIVGNLITFQSHSRRTKHALFRRSRLVPLMW